MPFDYNWDRRDWINTSFLEDVTYTNNTDHTQHISLDSIREARDSLNTLSTSAMNVFERINPATGRTHRITTAHDDTELSITRTTPQQKLDALKLRSILVKPGAEYHLETSVKVLNTTESNLYLVDINPYELNELEELINYRVIQTHIATVLVRYSIKEEQAKSEYQRTNDLEASIYDEEGVLLEKSDDFITYQKRSRDDWKQDKAFLAIRFNVYIMDLSQMTSTESVKSWIVRIRDKNKDTFEEFIIDSWKTSRGLDDEFEDTVTMELDLTEL